MRLFHALLHITFPIPRTIVQTPVRTAHQLTQRLLAGCIVVWAIALLLGACSTKQELTLASKNFEEQIEPQQNLVFEFSQPLVADSLTGLWDTTQYVRLQPRVAGAFKWTSPTTLVFSPSVGFKPSTQYQAELADALLAKLPQNSNTKTPTLALPKERTLTFHTAYLALQSADAAWTRSQAAAVAGGTAVGAIELKVDMHFNYVVNPSNLAERLNVTIDGKTVPYSLRTTTPSKDVALAVQVGKEVGTKTLLLTIDKGLRCAESEYSSPEPMQSQVAVPATDDFKITLLTTDYDDDAPVIRVFTTQTIEEPNIKALVSVRPRPQNFNVRLTDNGMVLQGAFQPDTAYQVSISRDVRGIFGVPLGAEFTQTVVFGSLQPGISFTESKAMYLTSAGNKLVGVKISGTDNVQVVVEKLYENNILGFARSTRGYDSYDDMGNPVRQMFAKSYLYDYDENTQEGNSYQDYGSIEEFGDPVFEKTYNVKTLPKQRGYYLLNLNIQDRVQGKGLYVVRVISTDKKWLRDSRIIAVSDVGLIAKQSQDEMLVVANSIKTAEPLAGVEVKLITLNNQTPFKPVVTDKNGVARFTGIKPSTIGSRVAMVVASQNNDVNYLLLDKTQVETSRFEVGGLQENTAGLQAFSYGDRDMYRPGETVHLNTIVRKQDWQPLTDAPIKVKILLPNGKDYATFKHTLSAEGAAETTLKLPANALTGQYTAEVYTMNNVLLGARKINVEEFLPDRVALKLNLNLPGQAPVSESTPLVVRPGGSLQAQATATNLFGPPAANRDYTVQVRLSRKTFTPPKKSGLEQYSFVIHGGEHVQLEELFKEGKTNEQGRFAENITISPAYSDIGLLGGGVFATVFDETGRPVHRYAPFEVPTQEVFFGIKPIDRYLNTRQPVQIPIVAATPAGKVADGAQALVRVVRYNWVTVLEREPYGSRYRYVSQRQELTEFERTMTVSGLGTSVSFTPAKSGEYEVRVSKPGARVYVSQYFYAYGYGDTQASSFEVSKEGEITIEAEKDAYTTGETANLLFKTPFAGKLLITVERNRVLEQYWVNTDQKSAKFSLPIKEDHLPNIYIGATLIKPVDDGSMPLTVAYGFTSLAVENASTRLPVSVSIDGNPALEQTRSKTKKTITVSTGESNAEVTVAVVDEGILQLKNFKTPDPHGFFYQKRALQVSSHNVYPYLFPELAARSSSVAGDASMMENRLNPFTNKRVKLVALWSGTLKTTGGKASYTVDIPEFSGALRVMAVAYKGKAFGSAEKTVRVADPIVVSSALPRFLSPNDQVLMPVTLSNTTTKPAQVTAQVDAKGLVNVVGGGAQQNVTIPPNSEAQVVFTLAAANTVGTGAVTVTVKGLGETFSQTTDLTIRPITSLVKASGSGLVKAGGSASFELRGNYVPTTAKAMLVVSKSPIAQFAKHLSSLVAYPYGCAEQTISRAFPQLYVAELAQTLGQVAGDSKEIRSNVQEAVSKLASMQLYNGSIAYWQGGTEESWWSSAYAAHFLHEAQQAGYAVSDEFGRRLYGYLSKKVKERNYEWYTYQDRSGQWRTGRIPAKTLFYSLYVLALANRPDLATMNYYKANKDSLALDSRYLLASAYALAGDKGSYKYLLPKEFAGERSARALGGSFYSYVRDEAIALNALMETDPENQQIGAMTRHLSDALRTERWLNTQEISFALLALGKVARRAAESTIQATITANGKQIGQFTGANLVLTRQQVSGLQGNVSIAATGTGVLYYFWETSGVSYEGKVAEEDSYLRVRRTFLDRTGTPISPESIQQNDLVVVKLSLASTNGATVENVVITDMLAAGLEIENPRISSVPEMNWIQNNTEAQYVDIRDDRVLMFVTAQAQQRDYYYLCRAVSKGVFQLGPVSADAMYNGEYHSYSGAGILRVSERGASVP